MVNRYGDRLMGVGGFTAFTAGGYLRYVFTVGGYIIQYGDGFLATWTHNDIPQENIRTVIQYGAGFLGEYTDGNPIR
jgi:hypothetical protein